MGQEHKEYTWNLIAKKLTGEASMEELQELEALLRNNPELHYPMQTMTDLWKASSPDGQRIAERAFSRHLDRMEELNTDYIRTDRSDRATPLAETGTGGEESELHTLPQTMTGMQATTDTPTTAGSPSTSGFQTNNRSQTNSGEATPDDLDTDMDIADPQKIKGSGPRRRMILVASVFCLLTITGILFFSRSGLRHSVAGNTTPSSGRSSEIFTRNGSRTNLVLPDSTLVWLNAGSRITYDKNYGNPLREVTLTGEAYFDVAHNAGKPFVIHTARVDIKVLGTSFNVKSYPSDRTTEATLIRGSIEVSIKDRPTEKIILKPNEKLVVANDDSTLHRNNLARSRVAGNESLVSIRKPTYEFNTGTVIETSWVDNKLIFQDEDFRDLAIKMERWYGVNFKFTNSRQEEWRFTGNFQKETIEQALDALKLTEAFSYVIQENQITIYDR